MALIRKPKKIGDSVSPKDLMKETAPFDTSNQAKGIIKPSSGIGKPNDPLLKSPVEGVAAARTDMPGQAPAPSTAPIPGQPPQAPTPPVEGGDTPLWKQAYDKGLRPEDVIKQQAGEEIKPFQPEIDPVTPGTEGTGTTGISGQPGVNFDINKDGMINENELTGDYKTFYDNLSETEKKLFLAEGENALQNNLDITESFAKYMRDHDTSRGRMEQDEAYRLKQEGISKEMSGIRESQSIKASKDRLDKLKQSIAYLGNKGMPGVSAQRVGDLYGLVKKGEASYADLGKMIGLSSKARNLASMKNIEQFDRRMEDITTRLNDDIDKGIQSTYNSVMEADANGQLDTVEELTAFRDKMYQDLDSKITGFSDASINQMKYLVNRVDQAKSEAIAYDDRTNSINQDMSTAQGFYVDGNGEPIISAETGQRINIPEGDPMPPMFDKASGQLITFKKDETGKIVANVDQVIDQPTFEESTISNYAGLVASGKIDMNDVPEGIRTSSSFVQGLANAPTPTEDIKAPKLEKIGTNDNGEPIYGTYNKQSGKYEPISSSGFNEGTTTSIESSTVGQHTLPNGRTITMSGGGAKALSGILTEMPDILIDTKNIYRTADDQAKLYGKGRTKAQMRAKGLPEKYAKAGNKVTWVTGKPGSESRHQSGNAVDLAPWGLPANQQKAYTDKMEPIMNKHGFYRPKDTMAMGDYGHFEYKQPKITDKASVEEYSKNKIPQYTNYIEKGTLPTGIKSGTARADKFIAEANKGYMEFKNKSLAGKGFNIVDEDAYKGTSPAEMKRIEKGLGDVKSFEATMDKLLEKVGKYGTEVIPGTAKAEIQQLLTDARMQAKEIYNLGALAGPDMDLIARVLPDPTTIGAKLSVLTDYNKVLKSSKSTIMSRALTVAEGAGLKYGGKESSVQPEQTQELSREERLQDKISRELERGVSVEALKGLVKKMKLNPDDFNFGGTTEEDLRSMFESGNFESKEGGAYSDEDESLLSEY